MDVRLSCSCGSVTGVLRNVTPKTATRATCYCTDCQAFSEALGQTDRILDSLGGTAVFQTFPARLTIETGADHLRTMKVTSKPALRWYAACCDTPLAFSSPSPQVPILGLVEANLTPGDPDQLPPSAGVFFPQEAWGLVTSKPANFPKLALVAVGRAIKARLAGESKKHPLFGDRQLAPEPRVLTPEERAAIDARLAQRRRP